jgi:hypothetical protein
MDILSSCDRFFRMPPFSFNLLTFLIENLGSSINPYENTSHYPRHHRHPHPHPHPHPHLSSRECKKIQPIRSIEGRMTDSSCFPEMHVGEKRSLLTSSLVAIEMVERCIRLRVEYWSLQKCSRMVVISTSYCNLDRR